MSSQRCSSESAGCGLRRARARRAGGDLRGAGAPESESVRCGALPLRPERNRYAEYEKGPATHIHITSGLTYTRKIARPSSRSSPGMMYRSSTGVERIAACVEAILKPG